MTNKSKKVKKFEKMVSVKKLKEITENYDKMIQIYQDKENDEMVEYWLEKKWMEIGQLEYIG